MSTYYLPPVTHVIALATIRRQRRLPVPGTVVARVNQKVQATEVVAEAEVEPRHYFLDIARGLGVPEREVNRFLIRERGERVEAGEIIAGPVGLTRRTVRAPADGRVAAISGGRVLFEARGRLLSLQSSVPGTVVSTDGSTVVIVETTGALIQGVWGNGREDFGVLRRLGQDGSTRLDNSLLDINHRGAILMAGICADPAPLHQAAELAVRGLILGSMTSDLVPLVRRLGFSVVLTEGFGEISMNTPAFTLMSTNAGRDVAVDGRMVSAYEHVRPEVVIPLPATQSVELPDEVIPLIAGVRIRILRGAHQGKVGVVREVYPRGVSYASGVVARSAQVDVEDAGAVNIPLANLEILQ